MIQPTFSELVGSSDYIVRAVVKSVDSAWRENAAKPGQRYIGTKVTLEVREVIAGNPPSPLVLDMLGGRVGDDELVVSDAPQFVAGQEHILFIQGNGVNYTPLNGLMHGFFTVSHNAVTGQDEVLRSNGEKLYSETDLEPKAPVSASALRASGPALSPATFIARIRQQQNEISTRAKQQN